jgi:hypothetical protein
LNTVRSELRLNKSVAEVTNLLTTGCSPQQIVDFACFLDLFYSNGELLLADVRKYGSVDKTLEVLSQKLTNLQSQTTTIEVKRDSTNISSDEIHDDGKSSDPNAIPFGYPYLPGISAFIPRLFSL